MTLRSGRYVVCIDTAGNGDLQLGRIYRLLPDAAGKKLDHARVVDDSGEDYLYPARLFLPLHLRTAVRTALLKAGV